MTEIITTENLGYVYTQPPRRALENVTFSVERGQFVAIMGPNGSGKTTLVKLLLGLLRPSEGCAIVRGACPTHQRHAVQQCIGYVPQHEGVNSQVPVTARDVVHMAAACRYEGVFSRKEINRRVYAALDMVDLADMANHPFRALSGGQQQRALIARALVVDPVILIADEPFAGVDAVSHQTILNLLHTLSHEKEVTVLAVVHDINPMVHFLDRVLLLNTRMVAFGLPAEVLTTDVLRQAYGKAVPILTCDAGFLHPITGAHHDG